MKIKSCAWNSTRHCKWHTFKKVTWLTEQPAEPEFLWIYIFFHLYPSPIWTVVTLTSL